MSMLKKLKGQSTAGTQARKSPGRVVAMPGFDPRRDNYDGAQTNCDVEAEIIGLHWNDKAFTPRDGDEVGTLEFEFRITDPLNADAERWPKGSTFMGGSYRFNPNQNIDDLPENIQMAEEISRSRLFGFVEALAPEAEENIGDQIEALLAAFEEFDQLGEYPLAKIGCEVRVKEGKIRPRLDRNGNEIEGSEPDKAPLKNYPATYLTELLWDPRDEDDTEQADEEVEEEVEEEEEPEPPKKTRRTSKRSKK